MPTTVIYDSQPYSSIPVRISAPSHLALASLWHNGPASPLGSFRAAELGCGDGANLLALAFYGPQAELSGFDNASTCEDRARRAIQAVGIDNLTFHRRDLGSLKPPDHGPLDYIVIHGVFSWIAADVRRAVLDFCRAALAPGGLAYISFNTYPGWSMRGMVRDLLLRSLEVIEAPIGDKGQRAIEVAGALVEDLPSRDSAYGALLARELERVRDSQPFYVLHEYLAEHNRPFWFRDFTELVRDHGLDHLTDAQFCRPEGQVPRELVAALGARGLDPVRREETIDLLCERHFRASVLCRDDAPRSELTRRELLDRVHIATALSARSDPFVLDEGIVETFTGPEGWEVTLDSAITKAAVLLLAAQFPRGARLAELFERASAVLLDHDREVSEAEREVLAGELVELFERGQVELRLDEPRLCLPVGDRPRAHGLARFEATQRALLTSPLHTLIPIDEEARELVRRLDGTRAVEQLQRDHGIELVDLTLGTLSRWGLLEPLG